MERHISDEGAPYADGPVEYSFDSPFKTSHEQEIRIVNGSSPTLHTLANLYLQRMLKHMKTCGIRSTSLLPSFAAIAQDQAGKIQVLPLTNLDLPLRALGWASAEAEAKTGRALTINLVIFLRHILRSQVRCFCRSISKKYRLCKR